MLWGVIQVKTLLSSGCPECTIIIRSLRQACVWQGSGIIKFSKKRMFEMRWKVIGAILAFIYCYGVDTLSAQTTLASNGKSDYRVLVPANAPRSVQMAAKDFLEMFQRSTGVQMPLIVENTYEGNAPFVSLGNTRQARDAGIKVEDLAEEGFRIVLSKGNLFIIGKDTPDGKTTKDGGIS